MQKKSSNMKLKARLAMTAFVLITLLALVTTTVGAIDYALKSDASQNNNQISTLVTTSLSLQATTGQGN